MGNQKSADVNTAQAAHTPTPWKIIPSVSSGIIHNIGDENGRAIAGVFHAPDKGRPILIATRNAELIVRAVNAHDGLVAACRAVLLLADSSGQLPDNGEYCGSIIADQIRAALAKAEVKS